MDTPRLGQHVICDHGTGTLDAVTIGDTGSRRYRIRTGNGPQWYHLDEIIAVTDVNATP